MTSQLSKNRGKDLMLGKEKAKNRLINLDDSNSILKENENFLLEISKQNEESLKKMNLQQIRKVRDSLIAAATIRLPRRSKELITLSLEEYQKAEERLIEGEIFKIIHVHDQKNAKAGKPAPVVFSSCEYNALTTYVKYLRPRIGKNITINNVFTSCTNQFSTATCLNFSSIYKIMQKFSTSSGKKLSSRALRGSKVTDSRNNNYSQEQREQLATAMSHSLQTADRNYNYSNISDSVAKVIALDKSLHDQSYVDSASPSTSTPLKPTQKRKITRKENPRKGTHVRSMKSFSKSFKGKMFMQYYRNTQNIMFVYIIIKSVFDYLSYAGRAENIVDVNALDISSFDLDTSTETVIQDNVQDFNELNAYCPKKRIRLDVESVSNQNTLNGE